MTLNLDVYSFIKVLQCVMSTLNNGLQNVATARVSMEPAKEIRMKSLGNLKKIREAATPP